MSISISFSLDSNNKSTAKRNKGKSLIAFPDTFCVIDIETTGLDPYYDSIIEVAALLVENGCIVDRFSSLVHPTAYSYVYDNDDTSDFVVIDGKKVQLVDEFITELTGITNEMLLTAPPLKDVLTTFLDFVGTRILIGHNVNFDINFLYDNLLQHEIVFQNDFVDTLRLARKLLPQLPNHKLATLSKHYNISTEGLHRSEADCIATLECLNHLKDTAFEIYGDMESVIDFCTKSSRNHKTFKEALESLHQPTGDIDETNPLFGKHFVFTGTLEKMPRKDAMQIVLNFGGYCDNSVIAKTNFLVLGNNDYRYNVKDGKSSKQKKAEALKLKGNDIEIISENVFYDMIE